MSFWCNGCGCYHDGVPDKVRSIHDANGGEYITERYCDNWQGTGLNQYLPIMVGAA